MVSPLRRLATRMSVSALLFAGMAASAHAQDQFGKPGEPIKLVVGHPCCYTAVWSVMALRGRDLWKKYLPAGSTVEFEVGLQGSTIVNGLLAGKQHIGYIGDLPAIIATTKERQTDIRIVAPVAVAYDQCNVLLVRANAPAFDSASAAATWLQGKQFSVPKGACSDLFSKEVFGKTGVTPGAFLNQNVEVITSNFRAGKIDGAAIWEPIASHLVSEGLARRVASGADYGLKDSSYVVMSADLIKQRPDVVKAWLNAELDAQLFISDPKNSSEVIQMVMKQTTGFPEKSLWKALYGTYPKAVGGTPIRLEFPFAFTTEVMKLIESGASFLHEMKAIPASKLRQEAVMPDFAVQVLKERSLKAPVGTLAGLPDSAYKGK
jgi:NitT/TauT family transport system substrate-binding protein